MSEPLRAHRPQAYRLRVRAHRASSMRTYPTASSRTSSTRSSSASSTSSSSSSWAASGSTAVRSSRTSRHGQSSRPSFGAHRPGHQRRLLHLHLDDDARRPSGCGARHADRQRRRRRDPHAPSRRIRRWLALGAPASSPRSSQRWPAHRFGDRSAGPHLVHLPPLHDGPEPDQAGLARRLREHAGREGAPTGAADPSARRIGP